MGRAVIREFLHPPGDLYRTFGKPCLTYCLDRAHPHLTRGLFQQASQLRHGAAVRLARLLLQHLAILDFTDREGRSRSDISVSRPESMVEPGQGSRISDPSQRNRTRLANLRIRRAFQLVFQKVIGSDGALILTFEDLSKDSIAFEFLGIELVPA